MDGFYDKLKTQFYIFTHKWGLIDAPTEKAYKEYNFSIHNLEEQMFLKRLWSICAVEELSEFVHAESDGEEHMKEEACDFFNFLMSGFIAMGYEYKDLPMDLHNWGWRYAPVTKEFLWDITDAIHNAMNKLKNRPWTQSNFKVDLGKFNPRIKTVGELAWQFILGVFDSWDDFEHHFNKKIEVNIRRIKSGY